MGKRFKRELSIVQKVAANSFVDKRADTIICASHKEMVITPGQVHGMFTSNVIPQQLFSLECIKKITWIVTYVSNITIHVFCSKFSDIAKYLP